MPDHYLTLVDDEDNALGYAPKYLTHQLGLRHRAFSIFLFDQDRPDQLLLQQRASSKYHCPELWSNTCCSHPSPGESITHACKRRLQQELHIECDHYEKAGILLYEAQLDNQLIEHEFDHIRVGFIQHQSFSPNHEEVMQLRWESVSTIQDSIEENPEQFTPWFPNAFSIACRYLGLAI